MQIISCSPAIVKHTLISLFHWQTSVYSHQLNITVLCVGCIMSQILFKAKEAKSDDTICTSGNWLIVRKVCLWGNLFFLSSNCLVYDRFYWVASESQTLPLLQLKGYLQLLGGKNVAEVDYLQESTSLKYSITTTWLPSLNHQFQVEPDSDSLLPFQQHKERKQTSHCLTQFSPPLYQGPCVQG